MVTKIEPETIVWLAMVFADGETRTIIRDAANHHINYADMMIEANLDATTTTFHNSIELCRVYALNMIFFRLFSPK